MSLRLEPLAYSTPCSAAFFNSFLDEATLIIFPLTLFWKRMVPREVIQAFMQGFQ